MDHGPQTRVQCGNLFAQTDRAETGDLPGIDQVETLFQLCGILAGTQPEGESSPAVWLVFNHLARVENDTLKKSLLPTSFRTCQLQTGIVRIGSGRLFENPERFRRPPALLHVGTGE